MKKILKYEHTNLPFPVIQKSVNNLVNFVKPTFGASKNKVLIDNGHHVLAMDDGVKIAQEFGSDNRMENAVINFIKSTSQKTNDRVGDGTTGSMILLQAIINELPPLFDSIKTVQELEDGLFEAKQKLLSGSQLINTEEELFNAAYVSSNDEAIAEIVSKLIFEIGYDSLIAVDISNELMTTYEISDGLEFAKGYVHPFMATDQQKMQTILKDCRVLLFNGKVGMTDLTPLLQKMVANTDMEKQMLVIADDYEPELINLINRLHGTLTVMAVKTPAFGNDKIEWLKDIAALCNSPIYDVDIKNVEVDYSKLGGAKKIIVGRDSTIIIDGYGDVKERVDQLKETEGVTEFDKQKIKDRIAKLSGGAATIKVGGLTEEEMKATADKIEDSVNSTRLAYKSGVVDGAGVFLATIETSSELLNKALKAPAQSIKENMGDDFVIGKSIKDSTEVLIAALESAVSIAILLISSKGLFIKYEEENHE